MSTGAANFNNELVKCIEDLRDKREELNKTIIKVFGELDCSNSTICVGRGRQGENPEGDFDSHREIAENE